MERTFYLGDRKIGASCFSWALADTLDIVFNTITSRRIHRFEAEAAGEPACYVSFYGPVSSHPSYLFIFFFSGSGTAEFLAIFMNSAFQNPAFGSCCDASAKQKPVRSWANKTAPAWDGLGERSELRQEHKRGFNAMLAATVNALMCNKEGP